ncbi:hypothetical protein M5689_013343 [Euphorbia peplus]|nr:hypothetical protein M5689_013343 [Euphorbia peplus]
MQSAKVFSTTRSKGWTEHIISFWESAHASNDQNSGNSFYMKIFYFCLLILYLVSQRIAQRQINRAKAMTVFIFINDSLIILFVNC